MEQFSKLLSMKPASEQKQVVKIRNKQVTSKSLAQHSKSDLFNKEEAI